MIDRVLWSMSCKFRVDHWEMTKRCCHFVFKTVTSQGDDILEEIYSIIKGRRKAWKKKKWFKEACHVFATWFSNFTCESLAVAFLLDEIWRNVNAFYLQRIRLFACPLLAKTGGKRRNEILNVSAVDVHLCCCLFLTSINNMSSF